MVPVNHNFLQLFVIFDNLLVVLLLSFFYNTFNNSLSFLLSETHIWKSLQALHSAC